MIQSELVSALDEFFDVNSFNEHQGWFMSDAHLSAIKPFIVPDFWEGPWNGLMLDNAADVDRVYLMVFPSSGVLDTIIAKEVERGAAGAMIFAHHPAMYDEKLADFVQIPMEQLEELAEHHISFYNCHAPLDCHPEISTSTALAKALGLHDTQRFGHYVNGLAGVLGTVSPATFQNFAMRLAEVCELPTLRYDQILHNAQPIQKVAVVAGGGGDPQFIDEAKSLGADTYVTGHWHLFGESAYAEEKREEFQTYVPPLGLNLLGASHYGSELVVMRDQLKAWFREEFDIETILIRQENAWGNP